jgi:hypothetical protein
MNVCLRVVVRNRRSSFATMLLQAAGRVLSNVRDADAIIETFDMLRHHYPKRLSAASYRRVRRGLTRDARKR